MKKIYSTLAIILVIAAHFAIRFFMEDAYTFSASQYKDIQTEQVFSAGLLPSTAVAENPKAASTLLGNGSFSLLQHDAFNAQWNP